MLRTIIYLMALWLTACDVKLPNNQTVPTPTFQWAVIDQSILQTKILEQIKQNDAFYKENDRSANSRETSRLSQQIGELTQTARQKCVTEYNKSKPSEPSKSVISHPKQMSGSLEESISMPYISPNAIQNTAYRDCIANVEKDQLVADLKAQMQKLRDKEMLMQKHDEENRKLANEMIEKGIKNYAEQHGYQLIVNKQYNSVSYNRDKVVLEVTNDVLDSILKSLPS